MYAFISTWCPNSPTFNGVGKLGYLEIRVVKIIRVYGGCFGAKNR